MVSAHFKNISQLGNLPQIEVKIKNIWNHHLVYNWMIWTCHDVPVTPWNVPSFPGMLAGLKSKSASVRAFLSDTSLAKSTTQFARFNLTHHLVVVCRNSVFHQTVTLPSHQFLAQKSLKKTWICLLEVLGSPSSKHTLPNGGEWKIGDESHGIPIRKKNPPNLSPNPSYWGITQGIPYMLVNHLLRG